MARKKVCNDMATQNETIEHWSGQTVSFSFDPREEAFPDVDSAVAALLDQYGGNLEDLLKLFLSDYNFNVRKNARTAAMKAFSETLGIGDEQEDLFKSLVSTIRQKLNARDGDKPEHLKIARQKALEKVKAISLADV